MDNVSLLVELMLRIVGAFGRSDLCLRGLGGTSV